MNRSLASHVFVSYSRDDEVFLQRLVADLQTHGIMVWIDTSGIPPGTPDWEVALRAAISTSQAIILIASPHSRSSLYVRDELSLAKRYQHPIYPIWVDGTAWIDCIPLGYGGTQYIDARGSLYKSALNDLVIALNTQSVPSQLAEPYSKTYDSSTVKEQVSIVTSHRPTANPVPQVTPEYSSWHWIRTLTGHKYDVNSVAMSADGQMLASGSTDKTIKLWNPKTGDLLHNLTGNENAVKYVAMSADGQTLASVCRGNSEIKLWEKK
jgi:hypothetical protein